ncbi:hypothetical protein NM962_08190 [Mycobacterium sp. SVM_VP21]|nr:hypothetical protein NM962_08190 [Mycobacterium sp. SVM_VP21]
MDRRLILAGLAAAGGLCTTPLLLAAVAAADTGTDPSATGADAFTIGSYTFDPFTVPDTDGFPSAVDNLPPSGTETEGFSLVSPLSSGPPLLSLGGGSTGPVSTAAQYLEVYSPSGTDLGSIDAGETVTNLAGFTNTQFTVNDAFPPSGGTAADLPAVGSVYDSFNLGNGYYNVYSAVPGASGGADTVTDTLVTPYGNVNLDSLFGGIDAAAPLQPGDAFTGLADSAVAKDAFTIGGYTLDPTMAAGGEGFDPIASNAGAAPLLDIGGLTLGQNPAVPGDSLDAQSFTVYDGTGSGATDVGTISTGEEVVSLFGLTNTELFVTGSTAASGDTAAQAADLPATGTVLDSLNLGNGFENVYTATPGSSGTVTDTLVTPYGNVNLDSLFGSNNVANPIDPSAAFTGLETAGITGAPDAFTIGGTTFDPTLAAGGEGFDPVYQVVGAPPLLNLGGGVLQLPGFPVPLASQAFNVYDGTGTSATEVGNIGTTESVTNLLGLTNTEFTVTTATAASGADGTDLPTVGTVYDVFNLGNGIENIYTAIPGINGAADTVTDTLVTPSGDINLDSLFGGIDAAAPLDPGAAFTGLDAASAMATSVDPLGFLGF